LYALARYLGVRANMMTRGSESQKYADLNKKSLLPYIGVTNHPGEIML
jgi:hypothetical protein